MTPRERPTLALTSYGHALCHGSKVALPVITVTAAARDFDVGVEQVGLAITAFTVAMAASSVPAGLAGDRWGTTWVLAAFFWLTGLGATACALAGDYAVFLGAHAVLGLAAGLFHPAALGLLSVSTPHARLGPAMGMFGVAASAGITLTPLLFHGQVGWRTGFLGLAAAAFAGALACHLLALSGRLLVGRAPEAAAVDRRPRRARRNGLLFLMAVMGVNAFLLDGFMTIFPVTVATAGALALDEATLMTLVFVLGGVGQWLGGRVASDLLGMTRYVMLVFGQPLVLLGLAQTLDRPLWPYVLMATFACLNFMTQPIENKLLATFTGTRRRSTAYALKFMVALAIAAPAPWLMTRLMGAATGGVAGWEFPPLYRLLALLGMAGVFGGWLLLRESARPAAARAGRP